MPASRYEQHSLTWTDLFALVRKYTWVVLAVCLAFTVGAWVVLQVFYTDEYETQTYILVKIGRENAQIPASVQNGSILTQGVRIQDINSEVQMLSSIKLTEAVVDQFGPDAFKSVLNEPEGIWGYPKYYLKKTARYVKNLYKEFLIAANIKKRLTPREDAVEALAYGTKVEPVKESDVLTLKVRLPSAKLAVDCANALLAQYMVSRTQVRRTAAGTDFFDTELKTLKDKLAQLRDERAEVRRKWELSSPAEQRSNLLRELAEIRDKLDTSSAEITRLNRQREIVSQNVNSSPAMLTKEQVTAQNPSIQSIKERLTSLELERAKMAERYAPQSEVLTKADAEIASLRMLLTQEAATVVATVTTQANPLKQELDKDLENHEVQLAGLESERNQLSEPVSRIRSELSRLDQGSDEFETVERDYQIAEQFYLADVKKLEDAKLNDQLDRRRVENVSIIAPPDDPIEPVYPPKPFIMAIAPAVGLLLGIAYAALLESMEDRIRTGADLEAIQGINYLGTFTLEGEALAFAGADRYQHG
jgi:polysaccharide biosynthesis protein PslE